MRCWIYTEPWQEISMESSPVKEWGAWNTEINTSSISSSLLTILPKWIVFGRTSTSFLWEGETNIRSQISIHPFPDRRITAIAPIPGAVAMAHITVWSFMVLSFVQRYIFFIASGLKNESKWTAHLDSFLKILYLLIKIARVQPRKSTHLRTRRVPRGHHDQLGQGFAIKWWRNWDIPCYLLPRCSTACDLRGNQVDGQR